MDVKKLIVGFLVIAGAAGLSGFLLSGIGNGSTENTAGAKVAIVDNPTPSQNTLGANAFLPGGSTTGQTANVSDSTALAASSSDPTNLTDDLSDAFLNGVIAANPNGTVDASGNPVVNPPDTGAVAKNVAAMPAMQDLQAPNWDLEVASQALKIGTSSSVGDIAAYSASLTDIFNKYFVVTNVDNIVTNDNPDPSQEGYIDTKIKGALTNTLNLEAPPALANFQKDLVKMLVYEKNEIELTQGSGNDPVKTALLLQDEQPKYDATIAAFTADLQKAKVINGFSVANDPQAQPTGVVAFVDQIIGIKTAHAQWAVFDLANFTEWLQKYANDIALQILKNTLTALIQRKVLAWIQGSGAPRFIQQWGTTIVNAYQQTALNAINSSMQCVYSGFAPQIRLTLGAYYVPATNNVCANSFQAALGANTFQQFYNNFANGGFPAFSTNLLPTGNYYGGLFFQTQIAENTAQNQKQATIAKATANAGFKGDEVCDDGSNPNGTRAICFVNNTGQTDNLSNPSGGSCPAGETLQTLSNGGLCADGSEPQVTTPGQATGMSLNSALDSSPKLIASATSIVGLLNALLSSLLNSLASEAVNAASQAINNGLNGGGGATAGTGITSINPTTIQGGGTAPAPLALTCNPSTETASTSVTLSFGATGGQNDATGNPPVYTWTAANGATGAGPVFNLSFPLVGTYTITLADSTGDAPITCYAVVKP